jgi:peptidoglycan/LPS O-acetylase OafA/YrhL
LWFSLGMGAALVSASSSRARSESERRPARRAPAGAAWLCAVLIYIGLCAWLPPTPFFTGRLQIVVSTIAFGAIGALVLWPAVCRAPKSTAPGWILSRPALAWLGLISYGVFLWHFAIALELGFLGRGVSFALVLAGTVCLSIPIAAASYYLLEQPLRRRSRRTPKKDRGAQILLGPPESQGSGGAVP